MQDLVVSDWHPMKVVIDEDGEPKEEVNTDDIRNSWTTAQRDVEDLSALRAHEEHQREKIEEAETARRRREREESRAAAAKAKAKAKAKDDDGVIDLCDSDEDVVEVMKEEKGASRNGDKENSPDDVEVIPPKEPTRADLAAAAAKRRAQY